MDEKNESIPMVPMACYEAQEARFRKTLAYVITGWGVSILEIGTAIAYTLLR